MIESAFGIFSNAGVRVPPAMMAEMLRRADELGVAGAYFQKSFGDFEFEGITPTPPTPRSPQREGSACPSPFGGEGGESLEMSVCICFLCFVQFYLTIVAFGYIPYLLIESIGWER